MKHKHNVYKPKESYLKRYTVPVIGIILIVILMAAINFFNSSQSETLEEELLMPDEIKEQGAPELTKLNPDPQIKEGW
jgi:uncharacterized protein YpmB